MNKKNVNIDITRNVQKSKFASFSKNGAICEMEFTNT